MADTQLSAAALKKALIEYAKDGTPIAFVAKGKKGLSFALCFPARYVTDLLHIMQNIFYV